MNHFDLLKRAFHITWRYKPLWLFGFLLALCGGGGGGGGGGGNNVRMPGGSGQDFGDMPGMPAVDPAMIMALIALLIVLVLVLAVVGVVVRNVARAALIGMVRQIDESQAVTMKDGWRWGWSAGAWRVFLVSLLINLPVTVVSVVLLLLAFSPLLLLLAQSTPLTVTAIILTVLAVLFVILLLIVVGAIITPLQELTWRQAVLAKRGVVDSVRSAYLLIRLRLKDVAVVWLLLFGLGLGWVFVALLVVLPVSLLAALVLGGIPGGLVYLLSGSWIGAAVAGGLPALLAIILITSFAGGLFITYQSAVWTLAYLELQPAEHADVSAADPIIPAAALE